MQSTSETAQKASSARRKADKAMAKFRRMSVSPLFAWRRWVRVPAPPPKGERAFLLELERLLRVPTTPNRTASRTHAGVHCTLEFDLFDRASGARVLPLLTSRFVPLKAVMHELQWFLSGRTDVEFLHQRNVHIWDANTTRAFLDSRGLHDLPEGQAGPIYGAQWRSWGGRGIDQVQALIDGLRNNRYDRRHLVSAWNAEDIPKMALPPCHFSWEMVVLPDERTGEDRLHCVVTMRSADMPVGVPFNIASYSLLTHMISEVVGIAPGTLVMSLAIPHVYEANAETAREQVRAARGAKLPAHPTLTFLKPPRSLDECIALTPDDLRLEGYAPLQRLKYEMVA